MINFDDFNSEDHSTKLINVEELIDGVTTIEINVGWRLDSQEFAHWSRVLNLPIETVLQDIEVYPYSSDDWYKGEYQVVFLNIKNELLDLRQITS